MDNRYSFNQMDIYTKGDLKGYINGYINFKYKDNDYDHEFLYRFDDEENGDNFTLVSIDYGYYIPYIDEVWKDIEQYLTNYIKNYDFK